MGRVSYVRSSRSGRTTIDKPHVLWIEVGFGIAVAVFAALVVIGREAGTSAFTVMMLVFLAVFIGFTIVAELAAVRSEQRVRAEETRRSRAGAHGRPLTEI